LRKYWLERAGAVGIDATFRAEINAARAVQAGGGVPIGEHRAVMGLLGARALMPLDAVVEWMGTFGATRDEEDVWQERACRYFSELAEASALFEDERFSDVVNELSRVRCDDRRRRTPACRAVARAGERLQVAAADCRCFRNANPGFAGTRDGAAALRAKGLRLLEQTYLKLALHAISTSPAPIERVVEHWQRALETARGTGQTAALLDEIRSVAISRARYLCDPSREQRDEAIDEASRLLQAVLDQDWDTPAHAVQEALADTLIVRAVFVSNAYDDEERARDLAREAYKLAPRIPRTIEVLSHCNVLFAHVANGRGETERALKLVQEAEEFLREGERLFPHHARWPAERRNIEEVKAMLRGNAVDGLEEILHRMRSETPAPSARSNRLVDAMVHEAQRKYADAIALYRELLGEDPSNGELQSKIAWCYRRWILHARENASAEEVRWIIRDAVAHCGRSEALRDIIGEGTGEEDRRDEAD
jgi:tetratricopeptide (TPR) repeat protein